MVDVATGQVEDREPTPEERGKSAKERPHAKRFNVALFTTYYSFVRIHKPLRVTPAMAAGVTDRLWEIGDIVALIEAEDAKVSANRGPNKMRLSAH